MHQTTWRRADVLVENYRSGVMARLEAAGVPAGPLLNVVQAIEHPQAQARRMLVEAGSVKMTGTPLKASTWPDPLVRTPAPAFDQHGAMLRAEFGDD